ncbi:MAG: tetratricopeptide repeat protein [Dissulfuribacterales bacterium]
MFNKHVDILVCLFLIITILTVYRQVRGYDFVNFDDTKYVTQNKIVQEGITLDGIVWAFTTIHAGNWHPLTWISHMTDCQLFGLNPGGHHLTSLLFHIINSLLLFFVFRKMTGRLWESAFIAALFALHPLHVESVAWVSERKDVLSTFFALLTLLSYIGYVRRPVVIRYLLIVLFFSFGLMSKPMLVTLPFVLLLLDFRPLNRLQVQLPADTRSTGRRAAVFFLIREKIPLFILVIISCCVTFYAQKHGGAVKSLDFIPIGARIANTLVAYAAYIGKMVYPVNLAFLYPYPEIISGWKVAGSGLLLGVISFLAIKNTKQRPYFITGWLWYLGTLVPVIGLVQVGMQSMADRYTYIPLIGLFVIVAWGVPELAAKWRYGKIWTGTSAIIILSIFMAVTFKQTGYWKNSITLFEHAIKTTSANYIAHYNLGNVLAKKGRIDEAIPHYLQALQIKPEFADAHNNLANALNMQGKVDDAIYHFSEALRIKSDYEGVHYNLGVALDRQGRTDDAIFHYLQAIKTNPDYVNAHYKLGVALNQKGRIDEAITQFSQAIRIKHDYAEAHNNLGAALFQKGDITGAIDCFQTALKIKPDYAMAKNNLKKVLMIQQQNKIN